ncbi:uncharacterized protein LOC143276590 [Babylonia areolata]|uniref:uncharacterized protein LOC143276590 n=1 Tax=Babylonia areolata TaxID=304850 RepID=UPI003FD444F7
MATRHIRSSSTASHHARTASVSSEIHITDTVSSLQRCVFGNVFRSQRQLTRFGIFLSLLVFAVYMLGPFGSSGKKDLPDPKPKAITAVRSVSVEEEVKPVSEYRATYFEEMGKRFANKEWQVKADSFHSNNILDPEEEKEEGQGQGSSAAAADAKGELTAVVEKVREAARIVSSCSGVPGLSVVMVKGNHAVQVAHGMADVGSGWPVTSDTKFLLNSISKTFLGQLLAVLMSESGRNLTWDSRVVDILGPGFELATPELTQEVTLGDLLAHRTGLSSGNLAVLATYPEGWTRTRLVKNLKHLPPSAPFRKTFLYSNMCGMLVAHVVETLGGAPWERLIVDKLLAPLGMLGSGPITSQSRLEANDVSRLYVPVEGRLEQVDGRIFNLGPLAPVALLATTGKDVARWLQFNLRQGALEGGRQLIPRDLWRPMWTKQVELSPLFLAGADKSGSEWPVKDVSQGYGLSWFINKYRGLTNMWHGGGLYSHYTLAWHFPEKEVALYTVINGYSGNSRPFSVMESLAYYTADLLLGFEPWLDKDSLCTFSQLPMTSSAPGGPSRQNQSQSREAAAHDGNLGEAGDRDGGKVESKFLLFVPEGKAKGEGGAAVQQGDSVGEGAAGKAGGPADDSDQKGQSSGGGGGEEGLPKLPLRAYEGLYGSSLFGNFSVFSSSSSSADRLQCRMNVLTGDLHPAQGQGQGHTFGVELTQSLRFLSKPLRTAAARPAFSVTFLEGRPGEITAVDIHSKWAMEVPLRFERVR